MLPWFDRVGQVSIFAFPKAGSGESLRFGLNNDNLCIPVTGARLVKMSRSDTALREGFLLLQFQVFYPNFLFGFSIATGRNALAMAEIVWGKGTSLFVFAMLKKGIWLLWRPDSSSERRFRKPIWRERFGWSADIVVFWTGLPRRLSPILVRQ